MSTFKPAAEGADLQHDWRKGGTPRQLRLLLILAIVCGNILVGLIAVNSLLTSKALHEHAAKTLTQNIASAIDLNVSRDVQKVDLALHSAVDELEHELSEGGLNLPTAGKLLSALEQRLPEVEAIRVARADGLVLMGKGINAKESISWSDRPSFTYLRDHPDAGIQIFGPVIGRVSKQYVVGFSRRFNNPDGSFAGVVTAPIALTHFSSLLSRFDVGPNGTLILRDTALGLITRVPALPDHPSGQVGNQVVSKDFQEVFEAGAETATSVTAASPDGFRRIFTLRRLSVVPMVAIVATAQQDYLTGWMEDVYRTGTIAGGFLILTSLLGVYLLRLMRLNEENVQRIHDGKLYVSNILDSLTEHIVVIDTQGVITAVNASWLKFAVDNGAADSDQVTVGANYLEVCSCVTSAAFQGDAQSAYAGIRAVLDGTQHEYKLEYACHSPTEQRWFVLHVLPLSGSLRGAVIAHQNVTQIHQAQAELKASEDKFRLIALNTSDGVVVFDASHRMQYVSPAYLQQLGYAESEELGRDPESIYALIHADDRDQVFASIFTAMEAKAGDLLYTYRVRHKEGHFIWREDHARFVYDGAGALNMTYVICRDVTGRKAEEEHLRLMSERLRELSRRLVQAQEHARHHLARELHELTSPNLSALRINLALLANATPEVRASNDFVDRVADTRALIDDTTSNIREICTELHSSVLDGGGMLGVVQNYVQHFARRTGLKVAVHCAHEETHLAPALALPLFRILQEALTNCAKHANAHTVNIRLQLQSLPMYLEVQDDGIGFDPSKITGVPRTGGLGLMNMRETAEFVGGTLSIHSHAGAGTTVCVDIASPPQESAA
jgi:PAS domain S-box-containing protein